MGNLDTYEVRRKLLLVVPGGNDDALARVGGQASQHCAASLTARVVHLQEKVNLTMQCKKTFQHI